MNPSHSLTTSLAFSLRWSCSTLTEGVIRVRPPTVTSITARFFDWVQGAAFYADVHREAVELALATATTPAPSWIDVGCGPGLVARLAAERGARAKGIDTSPAMIRAARRHPGTAQFEVSNAADLPAESADIVSAASLLCGVPSPRSTAATLWSAVRPGGALLLIETTATMTLDAARRIASDVDPHRRHALILWARSRNGTAFDRAALEAIPAEQQTSTPLLHGLVEAIITVKPR